jgi:tRNA-specific 2-thiouridylase
MCNQKIKFGMLWERALESGDHFDAFATGHYARVEFDETSKRYLLKKGVDGFKDQSYFLYRLSQEQLARVMLPLGHFKKSEIKDMARKLGLQEYADQKESQDFLETDDFGVLFEKNEFRPGNIVDMNGKVVGQHTGIIYYTVGQRKGLNIGAQPEPLHVVRVDAQKNEVVVGPKEFTYSKTLTATDLNWIAFDDLRSEMKASAKVRLAAPATECIVSPLPSSAVPASRQGHPPPTGGRADTAASRCGERGVQVVFNESQFAVTPGQSVVFYQDDVVLGGGVIG